MLRGVTFFWTRCTLYKVIKTLAQKARLVAGKIRRRLRRLFKVIFSIIEECQPSQSRHGWENADASWMMRQWTENDHIDWLAQRPNDWLHATADHWPCNCQLPVGRVRKEIHIAQVPASATRNFIYLKSMTEGPEGHLYCQKYTKYTEYTTQIKQRKKTNKLTQIMVLCRNTKSKLLLNRELRL